MKVAKQRKHRGDVQFEKPEQHDGLLYEPSPSEPAALLWVCPVCPADVGEWCGSFGDIHKEREPDPRKS